MSVPSPLLSVSTAVSHREGEGEIATQHRRRGRERTAKENETAITVTPSRHSLLFSCISPLEKTTHVGTPERTRDIELIGTTRFHAQAKRATPERT
jgi:hypothetical protein